MTVLPRGKMTDVLLKSQSDFATAAAGDYARTFVYELTLAEAFGLPDDPILNPARTNDRDPTAPAPDVHRHGGRAVVPLDLNHLGWWLVGLFGAPVTTPVAATGTIVFSGQPGVGSTITINGVAHTFVSGAPSGAQIQIGANLAATLDNIIATLNGSANTSVDDATYTENGVDTLTVTHDTAGPAGNAFTLAAAGASNGNVSAATLTGGCYSHVFTSGGETLPARSIEQKLRSSAAGGPRYLRHIGVMVNALTLRMAFESGYHRADIDLVGRSEEPHTASSQGGTPTVLDRAPLPAVRGVMKIGGVAVGTLLAIEAAYRNNLSPLEYVSDDEYVSGFEPGDSAFGGTLRTRYGDETFYDYGRASTVLDVDLEWTLDANTSLAYAVPRLRLEKGQLPFSGPGGIELSHAFRAEQDASAAMVTATLRNAVATY